MPASYDCIVLGLGGIGSAALAELAGRGVRVLGLEQFSPVHDRGSSHGESRVIRRAYFEHPDYVPLVDRAYTLWRELESASGRTLLTRSGLFLAGPPQGEAVAGTLQAAALHDLDIAEMSREEAQQRFPHFRIAEDETVVYEEDAGYLLVEDCVQAHLDVASARGAETRFGEAVHNWSADESTIFVKTDCGEYSAGRLIVTAGAWAGCMLTELSVPLVVRRKVLTWHAVSAEIRAAHVGGPVFLFEQASDVFYGFPSLDGESVKVAEHSGGAEITDPARIDRTLHASDARPVSDFLRRSLPGVDPAPLRHAVCMYTMTPDGHFIVDRHPLHHDVVVAAGFSGHGFKFAPAIGAALADLALDGRTELPIGFLGLSRFAL